MIVVVAISWLATALLAGGLGLVSLGIVRAGRELDGATWSTLHRALDLTIGPYMRALLSVAITSSALLAILAHTTYAVAAFGLVAVLVISLRGNIPINREVAAWSTVPDNWRAVRDRWNALQSRRTLFAVGALVAVVVPELAR